MTPVQYLEVEGVWLISPGPGADCEIIVAGDATGPATERLALLERLALSLKDVEAQASAYLDIFVDRSRFANADTWHLESIEAGRDPTSPVSELAVHFSIEGDIYGRWTVTLQEQDTRMFPVAFGRRQW